MKVKNKYNNVLRLGTKLNVIFVVGFLVCVSLSGVWAVSRTITSSSDNVDTFIRNSNGNYWEATGANIQVALNDLVNGGTVYLPASNISISSEIIDNGVDGITISGCGNGTVLYGDDSVIQNIINLTDVNDWVLENFLIHGNKGNNPQDGDNKLQNNIYIGDCSHVTVKDVTCLDAVYHGVLSDSSNYGMYSNIYLDGAGFNQFDLYDNSRYNTVTNCISKNAGEACFKIHIGSNNVLDGNIAILGSTSVGGIGFISGARDNIITNNYIQDEGDTGSAIGGIYATGDDCDHNIISGNVMNETFRGIYFNGDHDFNIFSDNNIYCDGQYAGIYMREGDHNLINNNYIYVTSAKSNVYGIRLYGGARYNVFKDNVINTTETYAYYEADVSDDYNIITGNVFEEGTLNIMGVNDVIKDNIGYDNSTYQYIPTGGNPYDSPSDGAMYFNSANATLAVYHGSQWYYFDSL